MLPETGNSTKIAYILNYVGLSVKKV